MSDRWYGPKNSCGDDIIYDGKVQGDNKGGYDMGNGVVILVVVVCVGWIVSRWYRGHAATVPPESMPRENTTLQIFTHGNTCLKEGKFAEATAAFQQVHELEPKHPHVAGRLAEVERQRQAASTTVPAKSTL
jgi:hypothetical protein